jgi:hypothetical protein
VPDATHETWRPIPGYECLYEVSDLGRVRSLPRKGGNNRTYGGKILKLILSAPYLNVALSHDGIEAKHRVHSLVMLAFAGPRPVGQEVRHGPGGALDNRLTNLCYGTPAENSADMVRDGTVVLVGAAALNSAKTACLRGHDFTPENTRVDRRGHRYCRQCNREHMREVRASRRAS